MKYLILILVGFNSCNIYMKPTKILPSSYLIDIQRITGEYIAGELDSSDYRILLDDENYLYGIRK